MYMFYFLPPHNLIHSFTRESNTDLMSTYSMPSNEQIGHWFKELTANSWELESCLFPFIFLPSFNLPKNLLCCIPHAFRADEWMHWFALVTNTQHRSARKGYHSPVKFYVEKLLMMPSGPVSFRGENELLRQTCRSCKPFVIRKWSMQQGKLAKLKDSVALMMGWYYQWKSKLPTSWISSSSQWALLADNHRVLRN